MKYLMMVMGNEESWKDLTPEQTQVIYDTMGTFNREMIDAGVFVSGAGLQEVATAKTVRFGEDTDPIVSDGPFAEAKEYLAGYWIIECTNTDEALAWATKAPMDGGAIEVRPIADEA